MIDVTCEAGERNRDTREDHDGEDRQRRPGHGLQNRCIVPLWRRLTRHRRIGCVGFLLENVRPAHWNSQHMVKIEGDTLTRTTDPSAGAMRVSVEHGYWSLLHSRGETRVVETAPCALRVQGGH